MKYVIEHLESKLYEWCIIEYRHIANIVGKNNLILTNVRHKNKVKSITKNVFSKSSKDLNLGRICLMSPYAKKTLTSKDSKKFDCLLFGGILGDNPPKKRTVKYFNRLKVESRNLGKKQMSTDTAVYVASNIMNSKRLEDFEFIDTINVKLDKYLSVELPFRYVRLNSKILLPKGLIKFLKKASMP